MNDKIFYVYAYLRSTTSKNGEAGTPYYIGKGKDRRAYCVQRLAPLPKDTSNIIFIQTDMLEVDALLLEIETIAKYGRLDLGNGCLRNRTRGGDGICGRFTTEENRENYRIANIGEKNPMYGRTRSAEVRQKQSDSHSGEKHHNYGKTTSDAAKLKMRAAKLGKPSKQTACPHCNKIGGAGGMKVHIYNCTINIQTLLANQPSTPVSDQQFQAP